jgi:hypothetical protein
MMDREEIFKTIAPLLENQGARKIAVRSLGDKRGFVDGKIY